MAINGTIKYNNYGVCECVNGIWRDEFYVSNDWSVLYNYIQTMVLCNIVL